MLENSVFVCLFVCLRACCLLLLLCVFVVVVVGGGGCFAVVVLCLIFGYFVVVCFYVVFVCLFVCFPAVMREVQAQMICYSMDIIALYKSSSSSRTG